MLFVFGIVCTLGCLVFYWHELLETQGWLNMTFFLYWWLLVPAMLSHFSICDLFYEFIYGCFLSSVLLERTQTYKLCTCEQNRNPTEVQVVVHSSCALWIQSAIVFLALHACRKEMTCYVTWTLNRKKKQPSNCGKNKDVGRIFGNC